MRDARSRRESAADVIVLVSPIQVTEAMQFFRLLRELVKESLQRGATWPMLSKYLRALFAIMEMPAVKYSIRAVAAACRWQVHRRGP